MADDSFEQMFSRERDRIKKLRESKMAEQAQIAEQIKQIDKQLAAIDAYHSTLSGRAAPAAPAGKAARGSRGRRGGKREEILSYIKQKPSGITRGELIEQLGVKGDRSAEQSISNALSALKRTNQVYSSGGRYTSA